MNQIYLMFIFEDNLIKIKYANKIDQFKFKIKALFYILKLFRHLSRMSLFMAV